VTRTEAGEVVGQEDGPAARLRRWLVIVLIVVVLPTVSLSSTDAGSDLLWLVALCVAAILLPLSLPVAAKVLGFRPLRWGAWAAWGLALAMLFSLIVNSPATQAGLFWTVAALVGAGVACVAAAFPAATYRSHVVLPLAAVAAVQGALMALQTITEEPVALRWLWPEAELRVIDGVLRPQGTFFHVFEPALLATIALAALATIVPTVGTDRRWQVLAALAAVPIALSYSRSAALGAMLVLVFLVVAHRRKTSGALAMAIAMAIGLLIAGLVVAPGWVSRLEQSTTGGVDDVSLGRITLARQALTMIGDHPITGVGTAKYIPTLESDYEPDPDHPFAVHNFALRVTAEVGIPLGLAVIALTVAAGVQAVRSGPLAAAAFMAMVPWMLFDILYYDRVYGLAVLGVWWGVVARTDGRSQTSRSTRSS
jgi:O-antigen ligase